MAATTLPVPALHSIAWFTHFRLGNRRTKFSDHSPWLPPLVKIYGAIIFYLENPEKVEAYLKEQDRRWEELKRQYPKANDLLAKKLREAKEYATQTRS